MLMELELELPQLLAFTNIFRTDVLHLTFYIITWLHLIHLEILELFMLIHMGLHGIEAFSKS